MAYKIADKLSLPAGAVTETSAFFGTRGSGKTYACGKMVEEFHDGGAQVVVVDPVGVWYGLRIAANGRGRGLDIPVFGGLHGDVPLEPTGGELVARLVVEKRISVVLDVSMFTLGQQHKFVTVFCTWLFQLKKGERGPLHIVFDEAHEFLPQFVQGNEAEMVGAVRRLSKMGRNFGIGVSLISPRPAEVNKGSVNLTERMYCGRLKGPQDRKAIEAWASSNDADQTVLDELPQLKNGDLIAWTEKGPQRVRFLPKRTFDASKTPEAGDAKPAASLPKIDLEQVREAMAATIEETKMNDPKALRAKIAELERAAQMIPPPAPAKPGKVREVPIFREADLKRIERLADKLGDSGEGFKVAIATAVDRLAQAQQALVTEVGNLVEIGQRAIAKPEIAPAAAQVIIPPRPRAIARPVTSARTVPPGSMTGAGGDPKPSAGARAALSVLAQFPDGVTRRKLGILSHYAPSGSSMRGILADCRKNDWVEDLQDGTIRATPAGLQALGSYVPLPTGSALCAYWINELPDCPSRFLRALVAAYPQGLSKAALQAATEADGLGQPYVAAGSSMRGGLAHLRGLDLVDDVGDSIVASSDLFDAPAARGRAA
jgi:hypothetical protein